MNSAEAIIEAVSALERSSGLLDALGRTEDAYRCSKAAGQLRFVFVDGLDELDAEEEE